MAAIASAAEEPGKRQTAADLTTMAFDAKQRYILSTLERVGGALSLAGVMLIFVTFYASKRIRTVPNTFILFASIANVGACVASLIALSGIEQGERSGLCQTQAFLFEMFMQSDPWWSLAMAINVYLVFFWSTNPTSFRKHLWIYCTICFGVPAMPALICLLYKPNSQYIYGDAIFWCWIDNDFNQLRIWTYYLPIWVCTFLSAVIYAAVGYQVFHQRNQLRNLTLSNQGKETSTSDARDSAEKNLTSHAAGCYGTVTTEVQVTTTTTEQCCDAHTSHSITPPPTPFRRHSPDLGIGSSDRCANRRPQTPSFPVDLESGVDKSALSLGRPMSPCGNPYCQNSGMASAIFPIPPPDSSGTQRGSPRMSPQQQQQEQRRQQEQQQQQQQQQPPYSTTSVVTSTGRLARQASSRPSMMQRVQSSGHRIKSKLQHMDPVKLAYLRTSFVFAISVLVTWTPSSINRVYNLVYPDQVSYGLNLASAAVLPLQGVWNAVIYFSTSHRILCEELDALSSRRPALRAVLVATRVLEPRPPRPAPDAASMERAHAAASVDAAPAGFERTTLGGGALSRHYSADAVNLGPRTPRLGGNVRVQKGGELDLSLR